MDGARLATKGVALAIVGVAVFLYSIVMYYGPGLFLLVAGLVITASGGFIVGSALPVWTRAGALTGAAGLLAIVVANLGLVPNDAPAFLFSGMELAAFGIGAFVGGWIRLSRRGAARTNSGALSGR